MRRVIHGVVVALLLQGASAAPAHAQARAAITDPVQATIDGGGVSRDDSLLVVKLDWNEDGTDDYLIAADSDRQLAGSDDLTWTVFLSNSTGTYDIDPSGLSAPAEGLRADRRDEFGGKLGFITFGPRGDQTPIYGQYLENGRVTTKELAALRREGQAQSDEEMKTIAAQNEAEIARYVTPAKTLQYQPLPVADRWPASGPSREPPLPLAEEPGVRYNLAVDPLDDGRFLAYDKTSGEFLGYLIQNKFVSLQAAAAQGLPTKRDIVAERREIEAKQRPESQGARSRTILAVAALAVAIVVIAAVVRWRRTLAGREGRE